MLRQDGQLGKDSENGCSGMFSALADVCDVSQCFCAFDSRS